MNPMNHASHYRLTCLGEVAEAVGEFRHVDGIKTAMPGCLSHAAGGFSRTPGAASHAAGAFSRTVESSCHTGKILQPHGWKSQPQPYLPPTARLERPAVRFNRPAAVGDEPAVPGNRSGVRFHRPAVGFGPLGASQARQALHSITPPAPRHEAVVLGLRRSSHRAALHVGFAQSDLGWNP